MMAMDEIKRRIDVCRNCPQFIEWKTYTKDRFSCGVVMKEMLFPFQITKEKFEDNEIPDGCVFNAEYHIKAWNDEKKN